MGGRHSSHYEAQAQTVNLEDITSSDDNAAILQKLRADDPEFTSLGIKVDYPEDDDDFIVRREDDMGWLGYFVAKNSTLQYLYINIIDIDDASEFLSVFDRIGVFIEGLNRNRSIEKLHISSDIGCKNFRRMRHFFRNNNNLRELEFSSMNTTGVESARSIAYMLSQCGQSSLRKISFEDSEASDIVLAEISNHPQLEELDLDGNNLGREGCAALGNALEVCRNPQLQNLFLSNNIIDDVGLSSLVAGLRNCHNLKMLSLTGNELITVEGCWSLSTLFRSERCCLERLILDSINIGDDGVRTILAGLAITHSLQELHFRHNSIGNEGATAIAAGLVNFRSLKKLYLSHNFIGNEGATALADGLMNLQSLEKLYLSGNGIGDDGISNLAPALASLPSLEELDLARNLIGDDGLQALVGSISHCSNLTELYLSDNNLVTIAGLRSLSTLLRSDNCSLIGLYLHGINFGDDMAIAFANGLTGNRTLKSLRFDSTRLTPVGWSAFSRILCNPSSFNSIYLSNHSIKTIGTFESEDAPDDVKQFLHLNKHAAEVAIQKILKSHPDFDVESMFQWKLKLLTHVMSTLDRVAHTHSYVPNPNEDQEILISRDSGQKLRRKMRSKLQSKKLSTMYKFVRGMPLLIVDGYRSGSDNDAEIIALASPRKRKFEQLYH